MIHAAVDTFLEDCDVRDLPWARPEGAPSSLSTDRILLGNGDSALEVVVAWSEHGKPKTEDVPRLWKLRQGDRSAPMLLVVLYVEDTAARALVCGTLGDPSAVPDLEIGRLERMCEAALQEPDRHAAQRTLERLLAGVKDQLSPGLNNGGLCALHELRTGVPRRLDWPAACATGKALLKLTGQPLLHRVGGEVSGRLAVGGGAYARR